MNNSNSGWDSSSSVGPEISTEMGVSNVGDTLESGAQGGGGRDDGKMISGEMRKILEIVFFVILSGGISILGCVGNVINMAFFWRQLPEFPDPIVGPLARRASALAECRIVGEEKILRNYTAQSGVQASPGIC
ncbi:hypothetical protein PoB_004225100 [Plakobranchus ocellatus]|uniref:Uncharacterized protein n=1 Tax=Plakobranchus ocellatus TaxID=259542 RepID=A0AAV4AXB9_9GAST|nr:hypothetical protein PoB_004225100 [Plakobranchus ocellatus]